MPLTALLPQLRRFVLERVTDPSHVSGPGLVAAGVQFPDGRCALQWHAAPAASIAIFDSVGDVALIHGHAGATVVRWIDEAPDA